MSLIVFAPLFDIIVNEGHDAADRYIANLDDNIREIYIAALPRLSRIIRKQEGIPIPRRRKAVRNKTTK